MAKPEYDVQVCLTYVSYVQRTSFLFEDYNCCQLLFIQICRHGVCSLMTRFPLGYNGHNMQTFKSMVRVTYGFPVFFWAFGGGGCYCKLEIVVLS